MMTIRQATPRDEQAIVTVCAAAWFDEALFGSTIHPHRHEFPDDVAIFWHETIRRSWRNPRNQIIVSTTVQDSKEKIVGAAVWRRKGSDPGATRVEREWSDVGDDAFAPLISTHNRALDPSKHNILAEASPFFAHFWEGDRSINWYLDLCGVLPEYQKKGFGRQLVHWGLDRARSENVSASVISSLGKDDFYLRCGFDEIVGNCTQGDDNPLNGVPGGNVLFMWPKVQNNPAP